jgi:tyrosyl-tRNA synthetase
MNPEEKKDLHMKQAGEYISYLVETKDKIYDAAVKEKLENVIRKFQDLRDTQYWFDSGERELDKFYDRYVPFLNMIMENYLKLETSWNFNELNKVKEKLLKTFDEFIDTMNIIQSILPEDEISDAKAEVKAREAKAELEKRFSSARNF